jgi:Ca2+-transporting ATPase
VIPVRKFPHERLQGLSSPFEGLTTSQAADRLEVYGPNRILEAETHGWVTVAKDTLRDPMLWFLLSTSALFAVAGEWTEAAVLLGAMFPFFGMDAFLHRRTQASIEGLSSFLATEACVVRDGSELRVPAMDLVPGDLVLLGPDDPFPADGVLVDALQMQVDESALTGEALPVRKVAVKGPSGAALGAKIGTEAWGYAGTRVLTGKGRLLVGYTAGETLYGEIARSAVRGTHERTPLQRSVADLVKTLLIVAAIFCVVLAWVRIQQGHGWIDALLSALTLAVAALPEEFPVVLTFFLGVGVYRLAKRHALVRRGVVVENIGRVTCICSDKTGTLTEGLLRLTHCFPAPDVTEARLLRLAAMASRVEIHDPVDLAILSAAPTTTAVEVVSSFPFTEDRKRETCVLREEGALLAVAKGAPEVLLVQSNVDPAKAAAWLAKTEELAAEGHKVIACAWQSPDADSWYGGEPDRGFRFAGLIAFEDPVRPDVPEAVRECLRAQIHVIMITGDHPATATAVSKEIGLGGRAPKVIVGDELESRLSGEGPGFLLGVDVIARAKPAQKLSLVRALQGNGEIVAVTGDGVNDVPALQAADIGIAMGERGTRSAREVAAIVLLDDNFRSIVSAIGEGRQLFRNLQLSFEYLLMVHIPLVITAAIIPLAGYALLYLPIHVVWLEMIIHPTAMLVFQDLPAPGALADRSTMRRAGFFDRSQWLTIVLVGTLITAGIVWSFQRSFGAGHHVEHARAMALVVLTLSSGAITALLSGLRGIAARVVTALTIGSVPLFVQVPGLSRLMHLTPLHADDWLIGMAGAAVAVLPVVGRQLIKRWSAHRRTRTDHAPP